VCACHLKNFVLPVQNAEEHYLVDQIISKIDRKYYKIAGIIYHIEAWHFLVIKILSMKNGSVMCVPTIPVYILNFCHRHIEWTADGRATIINQALVNREGTFILLSVSRSTHVSTPHHC